MTGAYLKQVNLSLVLISINLLLYCANQNKHEAQKPTFGNTATSTAKELATSLNVINTGAKDDPKLFLKNLQGSWAQDCSPTIADEKYAISNVTISGTHINSLIKIYDDSDCTNKVDTQELNAKITVQKSSTKVKNAFNIDLSSDDEKIYTVMAMMDDHLYFGDPGKTYDGSTSKKRMANLAWDRPLSKDKE